MKSSGKSNKNRNVAKVKGAQSEQFTKLTDDMMTGRRVSKKELGPNKGVGHKSVVLVP